MKEEIKVIIFNNQMKCHGTGPTCMDMILDIAVALAWLPPPPQI
jgi:hypothetical protein